MIYHECFIKEDGSIGDISDIDNVPDNVLEHVMRTPHLDQVLCLPGGQICQLSIMKEVISCYFTDNLTL